MTSTGAGASPDLVRALRQAGLRPTRERLALGDLLLSQGDRHVTAEMLFHEALAAGVKVSLATVYNTLHAFTDAGMLRDVGVVGGAAYFDTNTSDHQHFYFSREGRLLDIPASDVAVGKLPPPPSGMDIVRVDVIVRLIVDSTAN